MDSFWIAAGSALWLGILTSISPCPLATNIAAISYISRGAVKPSRVLLTGAVYTLGRMLTYVVVGMIIVWSVLSIPQVSNSLQKYMNIAIGPLLIIVAPFIAGWVRIGSGNSGWAERMGKKAETLGLLGAGFLGMIFALTFCPVSAALFFGSLIPLALQAKSTVLMPSIYGAGTALPVLVFALLVAFGVHAVGRAFQKLSLFDRWARRITATIFIVVGVYLTLTNLM